MLDANNTSLHWQLETRSGDGSSVNRFKVTEVWLHQKKKRGKLPSKTGFRNVHFANQFHPLAGGITLARMRDKRKDIMLGGGGKSPSGKRKKTRTS